MTAAPGRFQGPAGWEKLPFFWFILFLSYRCTRRCSYCYAFNQVGDDNRVEMDEGTFSRLLDWIPEVWRANQVEVNTVCFLGGEPLLRTDRIRAVMASVRANTDGMQGHLFTNGDLVDEVRWSDLEDIQGISTNVTDLELEELARRMTIIGERSNVAVQTIVATLDDANLERSIELSRFGIEHGYRLRFYRNLYRGLDAEYTQRLLRKYHELCDLYERYVSRGYDVHTTFLFDTLIPTWGDESSPYLCGKSLATVFPDGTIGTCLRNHTRKTGTLFDADPLERLRCSTFRYETKALDVAEECATCDARTACQGGCPHDKLLLTGSRAGKSVLCEVHKEIIPRLRQLSAMRRERSAGAPVAPRPAGVERAGRPELDDGKKRNLG